MSGRFQFASQEKNHQERMDINENNLKSINNFEESIVTSLIILLIILTSVVFISLTLFNICSKLRETKKVRKGFNNESSVDFHIFQKETSSLPKSLPLPPQKLKSFPRKNRTSSPKAKKHIYVHSSRDCAKPCDCSAV